MTAAMDDPTVASNRAKMWEIAREVDKAKGMGGDASTNHVLRKACGEYGLRRSLALDQLSKRPLTDDEMKKGGIEVFGEKKDYGGPVNYVHAYVFRCKKTTLAMVKAWESEMGVGSSLCGSVRAKVDRHQWDNGALRLLISGEGLPASAHKYARGLQRPPAAVRAREPRQVNGRVANDGPAWNIPAGLVLAGAEAIDTVGSETYVWRTGDPHRSSRELHEAILALVFLGGLVWSTESAGLNQKVGGTFTDEQRKQGGKFWHRVASLNPFALCVVVVVVVPSPLISSASRPLFSPNSMFLLKVGLFACWVIAPSIQARRVTARERWTTRSSTS